MSQDGYRPSETQLHAFVDGFLAEEERASVERFLIANPGEAQRVEAYRRMNVALQSLRTLPDTRPFTPREFRPLIAWRTVLTRAVAAVLLLALGGGGGWWMHSRLEQREPAWLSLVRQAERAHETFVPEVVHPVEVTAQQGQHLRTWLSRRLGTPVNMPLLTSLGYDLVGGRLLPGNPGPAAQFMYQDKTGNRLTLYLAATTGEHEESSIRYTQSGSLWICYWMGKNMEFALTGELDRERLRAIAEQVYVQVEDLALPAGHGR